MGEVDAFPNRRSYRFKPWVGDCNGLSSLTDDKIVDLLKLKELADNKLKLTATTTLICISWSNLLSRAYQHFLPFSTMLSRAVFSWMIIT